MNRKGSVRCLLQTSVPSKPWETLHLDMNIATITTPTNVEILIVTKSSQRLNCS